MSNLSDLLPAGGGAKVITATASGNLATGQAVVLNANGTVSEISGQSESTGSEVVFETAQSYHILPIFDSSNNKIVIIYTDSGDSNHGKAIVGTVSGSSISYGTAVTFNAATTYSSSATFDSNSNKVVIVYKDVGDSNKTNSIVGTVSGTSISFGSEATITTNTISESSTTFDSNLNKVVTFYKDSSNSGYGTAAVGTVSGTSISYGSPIVFESAQSSLYQQSSCFDTASNKTVVVYTDVGNSSHGTAIVGTVSGTSISFGTAVVFHTAGTANAVCAFDTTNNKVVIAYEDTADSEKGKSLVGTVSGTAISYGSEVEFESGGIQEVGMTFDPDAGKAVVVYMDKGNSNYGTYAVGTVSGTSITYETPVVFAAATSERCTAAYDTNSDKVVIGFEDGGNSNYGTSVVLQVGSTNSGDFAGITNQAINNSASGEVVVEGGVITNASLLPSVASATFGSEVVFESANSEETAITYDTTNDKIVIFYKDGGNSDYGTAVVGTVSGSTISFGTPVVYQSAATEYNAATFDSANGKVVVACRHVTANAGKVYVGTVSGTSISFGSGVEFEGGNTTWISATYDSANEKVVLSFVDENDSSKGKARVGTVSGTSISFSGEVTFNSGSTVYTSITYDSNAGKVVIAYRDSGNSKYGTAIVGTVSGTSISFGSEAVFESAETNHIRLAYDSSVNKVVIVYSDAGNSDYITSVVATVSGTSVSFGSPVVISNSTVSNPIGVAYDSSNNNTFVTYQDGSNNNYGAYAIGTVSGTSISFTSSAYWAEVNATKNQSAVYDPDQQKVVIAFRDGGNSNYGTSIVSTLSSAVPNFTIGSTYYVQDDGTLATTSSSVTAGKAIANTTLLLKG